MARRALFTVASLAALSTLPGCVFVKPYAICRVWADWNTYGQCSLCVEKVEHNPYRRQEVEAARWRYGARPVPTGHCGSSDGRCQNADCAPQPTLETTPALPAPPLKGPSPIRIAPPNPEGVSPIPNVAPRDDTLPPPPGPEAGDVKQRTSGTAIDRTSAAVGMRPLNPTQPRSRASNAVWLFAPAR